MSRFRLQVVSRNTLRVFIYERLITILGSAELLWHFGIWHYHFLRDQLMRGYPPFTLSEYVADLEIDTLGRSWLPRG
jgi:hypothetical protein